MTMTAERAKCQDKSRSKKTLMKQLTSSTDDEGCASEGDEQVGRIENGEDEDCEELRIER